MRSSPSRAASHSASASCTASLRLRRNRLRTRSSAAYWLPGRLVAIFFAFILLTYHEIPLLDRSESTSIDTVEHEWHRHQLGNASQSTQNAVHDNSAVRACEHAASGAASILVAS